MMTYTIKITKTTVAADQISQQEAGTEFRVQIINPDGSLARESCELSPGEAVRVAGAMLSDLGGEISHAIATGQTASLVEVGIEF